MTKKAFQDYYPDDLSHCYGCGRLNEQGMKIKSYWDGEESVCIHEPKPYYIAVPGYAYGGLVASLIDCHSTGTAAAAKYRAENREMDTLPHTTLSYRLSACGLSTAHAFGSADRNSRQGEGSQGTQSDYRIDTQRRWQCLRTR